MKGDKVGSIADNTCPRCNQYSDGGYMCNKCATIPATSEALVRFKLLQKGVDVALPARENAPYDLLVKGIYTWHPTQVKTAYETDEGVRANVCKTDSKSRTLYRKNEVDFFAIVYGEDVYLIPYMAVEGKGRINVLSVKYKKWRLLGCDSDWPQP